MFVAVFSYLMMWGHVVVDGIVLMCRYVVTCGGNVAVATSRWCEDDCCRPHDVG